MTEDIELYVSAAQAAEMLGISQATLYSYVSRGFVRVHRTPGQRTSRYWKIDIERLKRRGRAGPEDAVLGGDSAITLITDSGVFYRGRNAVDLAETATLEEVCALLWRVPEGDAFGADLPEIPEACWAKWRASADLPKIDRIIACCLSIEQANPKSHDLSTEGFTRAAAGALRWCAAMVGDAEEVTSAPLHQVLSRSAREPWLIDLVRRLLVLSADHELDPTTLAVRTVANLGVTPFRVIMVGLLAASGQRSTVGRLSAAGRLLDEILMAADPTRPVLERIRTGEALPGFERQLHSQGDPRTLAMLQTFEERRLDSAMIDSILRAVTVAKAVTGLEPGFGLVNLMVGRLLGIAGSDGNVLRLPRIAGWIAHALEQFTEHDLVRPRARYQGPLP